MSEHYFPCGHKTVLGHTCPVCVKAALVAALRAVEWGAIAKSCPSCGGWEHAGPRGAGGGHRPDCQLDAALRAAEGEVLEDESEGKLTPFGKALIGREPLPEDAGQTYEIRELSKPD